tara:strand:+ start:16943 stop:17518 length:576 start_codon:yes stop_codon:yes gene_type:complete
MSNRFKDLKPPKPNMFRKTNKPPLRENNRWSKLDTTPKNNFKSPSEKNFKSSPEKNSRWNNLKNDEQSNTSNRFKHRQHRNNRNNRYNRYDKKNKGSGVFNNAKMVNGVPQIAGSVRRSFNIMDSIQVKQKKKRSPKKSKKKQQTFEQIQLPQQETEEEKEQKELWKQQLIAQYAYECYTDEEGEEDTDDH